MALKIEIKNRKDNSYELQAVAELKLLQNANVHLMSLPELIKLNLSTLPRQSVLSPGDCYKAIFDAENKKVDFYHLNSIGEPDRLVATITDDGIQHNPFNF